METETGNGFIADKEARVGSSGGESDMKLQLTDSFPYKMMMKKMIHLHNLNRPFESSETKNGGGGGPTFYNEGCDIYDVVGGGGGTVARTLQPFNTTAFKSPGGMAASLKFPFTSAQWQELERQALIYKYMMAAVPVPPDLLMPICRNLSDSVPSHSNLARSACFNLRFSSSSDPEPGRCRRTDGKKWRCSRDVAPDQKYCERHMHRGRPRSRKPVELHADINNINRNNTHSALPATPASACFSGITANTSRTSFRHPGASKPYQQPSRLLAEPDYKASPFESMVPPSPYKEPRCVDWTMKAETVPLAASIQQWPQQMRSKVGFRTDINNCNSNASLFQQYYEEPLNLNSYSNFGPGEGSEANQQNDQSFMFLNPELASLEDPPSPEQRQSPRGFIDAWSTVGRDSTRDTVNKSSVPSNRKLSLSCLTLSMSGGGAANEDTEKIQMGLGLIDSERDNGGDAKTHPLNWMNPISWMPSPPGGPLAEVLRPSTAATAEATGTNAASSHGCCGTSSQKSPSGSGGLNLMTSGWGGSGDAGSPRTTTASSPSDVLQKTLASLSDSSGSSSPRFTAGAAKSEIAIQWLNQSNLPFST